MYLKGLLGLQDLLLDANGTNETFQVGTSQGTFRTVNGLNASMLPLLAATRNTQGYGDVSLAATDIDSAIVSILGQLNSIQKFNNADVLSNILGYGSRSIISTGERNKLNQIQDIGSGKIITVQEREIINGINSLTNDQLAIVDRIADIFPVGSVIGFPSTNIPLGFFECDGRVLDRAIYSDLFAALGSSPIYGNTTASDFFLPDYRGQFLRGWDHGRGLDPDAAERGFRGDGVGGDNIGSIQDDEFESHNHGADVQNASDNFGPDFDGSSGGTSEVFYTQSTGGSETRPKNINIAWCIRYQEA